MANVFSTVSFVLGFTLVHACLLLWTAAMMPRTVRCARYRIEKSPGRCFLWGALGIALTVGLLAVALLLHRETAQLALMTIRELTEFLGMRDRSMWAEAVAQGSRFLILAPVLTGGIVGAAALSQLFADRMRASLHRVSAWELWWGAICTTAPIFLPIIGWFIYLPVVSCISVGAGVSGLCVRKPELHEKPLAEPVSVSTSNSEASPVLMG